MSDHNARIFLSNAAVFGMGVFWLLMNQTVFNAFSHFVDTAIYYDSQHDVESDDVESDDKEAE